MLKNEITIDFADSFKDFLEGSLFEAFLGWNPICRLERFLEV